jgi:hypothetical protein
VTVKEEFMRIFLTFLAVMFLFLSCDNGKSNLTDDDIVSGNDSDTVVEDTDVVTDDVTDPVDNEVDEIVVDDNETQDEDVVIEERSPEGISVSSGTGTISSGKYKMNLTVGKPFSGQVMKSESYKLEIVIK